MKAIFTNVENGSKMIFTDVTAYDLDSEPMVFTLNVNVGIDIEGNEQHIVTEQTIPQSEYTVEVLPDE